MLTAEFVTFLHTAMRMMMDMIMMATKARTAANTATWEYSAATGRQTQRIRWRKNVVNSNKELLTKLSQILKRHKTSHYKHAGDNSVKKVVVRRVFI